MRDTLRFAPVLAEDAEALVALRIEAMRESLERIGRFDAARARARFLSGFLPEHTRHIELEGQRVGFFVLRTAPQEWLLDHLYIRPAFQRRQIGSRLLARVVAQADEQGAALRVGALRGSDSNRFYERHGFRVVEQGEFDNHYRRPPTGTRQ